MELNELISNTAAVIDTAARVKEVLLSSELLDLENSIDPDNIDDEPSIKSSDAVNNLLDLLISSGSDSRLAKVIATATKIANATGCLTLEEDTVFDIASISDETAYRIKIANQVANGEIDIEEAADAMIDRAAARLIALAESYIDNLLPLSVDDMCRALNSAYPQTAPLTPIIKNTVKILQPILKYSIRKGITAVAAHAKNVIPKIKDCAKRKLYEFSKKIALA